jgi:hypothetical protein
VNQAANVRWLTRGRMTAPLTGADAAGFTHLLVGPALAMRRGAVSHPRARVGLPSNPGDATRCCSRRSRTTTRPS